MSPRKQQSRQPHRLRLNKAGMKALATAGAIAAGTQAYAEPLRFENPGNQWDWELGPLYGSGTPEQYLDISTDADNQPGGPIGFTSFKQAVYYGSIENPAATALYSYGQILTTPGYFGQFAVAVDAGTPIGDSGQNFFGLPFIAFQYYGTPYTYIPEGVQTYLGARIQVDSEWHYGWIGVVRNGYELDTFAWGYESEPGTPVPAGVPEPGSALALLALGFCAASRRR